MQADKSAILPVLFITRLNRIIFKSCLHRVERGLDTAIVHFATNLHNNNVLCLSLHSQSFFYILNLKIVKNLKQILQI